MCRAWIALGGNLGRVPQTFAAALTLLQAARGVAVRAVSSIHQTVPMGHDAGPQFTNGAAELQTELSPLNLLDLLQAVENQLGRVRERHWGPRTLDLDLLLYDADLITTTRLTVPHPQLWYRRFVLDPLAEIAADVVHPEKGLTIGRLRNRLLPRPLICGLAGGEIALRQTLLQQFSREFPNVAFLEWEGVGIHGDQAGGVGSDPALIVWLGAVPGTGVEPGPIPRNTSVASRFAELPLVPRLDLSSLGSPIDAALRNVLSAALGE